jgi:hypothetical protein
MYNRGLMQKYIDEVRGRKETPSAKDFMEKHEKNLKRESSEEMGFIEGENFNRLYKAQEKVSENDSQKHRGPSRMVEAEIMLWARENEVEVRGLERMSDQEKRTELVTGSQGRIDNEKMRAAEHGRISAMAENTATIMKDISSGGGGCLVGVNMGAAHLASLDVALQGELKGKGLADAQVQMSMLIHPESLKTGESPGQKMESQLRESVSDMRDRLVTYEGKVAYAKGELENATLALSELKTVQTRISQLSQDDQELRQRLKTEPDKVAEELNKDLTTSYAKVKADTLSSISLSLENNKDTTALKALQKKVGSRVGGLEGEDGIPAHEATLKDAQQDLEKYRQTAKATLDFAEEVENHINSLPTDTYQSFSPGQSGTYDLSPLDKGVRKTVGETTGLKSASSATPLAQEMEHVPDTRDKSTRAELARSNSLPKTDGALTNSTGTTGEKLSRGVQ